MSKNTPKSWWRSNSSSQAPTNTAPISSATKPAIATRPSVLVPVRLIARHSSISPNAISTVTNRDGVKPNSEPTKITAPVDTLAMVAISAQP